MFERPNSKVPFFNSTLKVMLQTFTDGVLKGMRPLKACVVVIISVCAACDSAAPTGLQVPANRVGHYSKLLSIEWDRVLENV